VIAQLLNRDFVLQQLDALIEDLERGFEPERRALGGEAAELDQADLQRALKELQAAKVRELRSSSGQPAFEPPRAERRGQVVPPLDDFSFVSRDPVISLVQSALEEYFAEREEESIAESEPPADDRRRAADDEVAVTGRAIKGVAVERDERQGRRLFKRFEPTDARWANSLVSMGIRKWKGVHAFNQKPAPPLRIADRVRLLLVGDWGTGIDRAQKVGKEMRKVLEEGSRAGIEQHVIHLGDVYYSGWQSEYDRRFLPHWPVRPEEAADIGSWCLNGNHDMYSGGHGYFDFLLSDARFAKQAQSSFFSIANSHWQILGLDTAYESYGRTGGEGGLKDPQAEWVHQQIDESPGKTTVLLSHHQLFSAFEKGAPKLAAKLARPLKAGAIQAWFWGHEHRCVLYAPHEGITYARCIGHGGVPVYMTSAEGDPYPPPALYEYREWFRKGLEKWALFGFAVLDFDGPALQVRYVDENGAQHQCEEIQ
jgi:hypothetical protein